ncbi:MAG: GNAT family N-acetyltransferase [Anaerolineaceae bacterium]|jgi:GNAT superfamily N-acetyltransferase|nr:GNAT family N-acetyltransferase [Anaerolineaceae bacterium]
MQPSYNLTLSIENEPSSQDVDFVNNALRQYNLLYAPADNYQPLQIFLRSEEGTILGGLLGETYWGWLHISILWIDQSVRKQGYGRQMLQKAEQEATRRGCHAVHLDTMSFQALPFYEGLGYTIFGTLNDLPAGHKRIFLMKTLP